MAKYQVNCEECGCSLEIVLFGKHSKREWIIENGTHICDECSAKLLQAKNARNAAANAAAGLPKLTGSEKQIAWAESLRKKFADTETKELICLKFRETLAKNMRDDGLTNEDLKKAIPAGDTTLNPTLESTFNDLLQESSAAWWIDNRNNMKAALSNSFYGKIKERLAVTRK